MNKPNAPGEGSELPALLATDEDFQEAWKRADPSHPNHLSPGVVGKAIVCRERQLLAAISEINTLRAALSSPQQEWIDCPNEQGWWWHSYDQDSHPHPYGILASNTGSQVRYFIQYPDSRWCDEVGGLWLKQPFPAPPVTAEGKGVK